MDQNYAQQLLVKVKTDYNQIAKDFSNTRHRIWDELKFLFEEYIKPNDLVLDAGCGNGRYLPLIKEKGGKYFGIDNSEGLIKIAKNKYPKEKFQVADVLDLPFEDDFFDKIYCLAVLHHIPSEELRLKFFQEAKRVLKPGGLLCLTVWRFGRFIRFIQFLRYYTFGLFGKSKMDWNDIFIPWQNKVLRYYHYFSQEELEDLARAANLKIVRAGVTNNKSGVRNNFYLVCEKIISNKN